MMQYLAMKISNLGKEMENKILLDSLLKPLHNKVKQDSPQLIIT